jgi:Aspartate carbamoyltransferase, catalytic chain
MLKGRHVIQPDDLSVAEIDEICSLAEQIIVDPNSFKDVCRGKILAALFLSQVPEHGSPLRLPCCV